MKLNIANPATGAQKLVDIEDERKVRIFYDKQMSQEVAVDSLGDEWKGYVFRITGGNDKQGFPHEAGRFVLSLVIVKQGEQDIPGLTDVVLPKRLAPKRASKIRRFFNLSKEDDVRQYVVRREVTTKAGKTYTKAPKIQRLVTPQRLQRKRHLRSLKKRRSEAQKEQKAEYNVAVAKYVADKKAHHQAVKAAHKAAKTA
ncbi:hypothetical protein CcaverHIS002_0406080 [Cutaneotrichosporon cavernicola]|nr:hypothetical protein CcaverHIS002_0406080 [Cutaneotrichosporon cavernicola]